MEASKSQIYIVWWHRLTITKRSESASIERREMFLDDSENR